MQTNALLLLLAPLITPPAMGFMGAPSLFCHGGLVPLNFVHNCSSIRAGQNEPKGCQVQEPISHCAPPLCWGYPANAETPPHTSWSSALCLSALWWTNLRTVLCPLSSRFPGLSFPIGAVGRFFSLWDWDGDRIRKWTGKSRGGLESPRGAV